MEVNGQLHDPAGLFPGKTPRYPLDRRLCEPQSRSGRSDGERNLFPFGNRINIYVYDNI
jgi:hypothetical protein